MKLSSFAAALRSHNARACITTCSRVWRVEARVAGKVVAQEEDLQVEEAAKKVLQRLSTATMG